MMWSIVANFLPRSRSDLPMSASSKWFCSVILGVCVSSSVFFQLIKAIVISWGEIPMHLPVLQKKRGISLYVGKESSRVLGVFWVRAPDCAPESERGSLSVLSVSCLLLLSRVFGINEYLFPSVNGTFSFGVNDVFLTKLTPVFPVLCLPCCWGWRSTRLTGFEFFCC